MSQDIDTVTLKLGELLNQASFHSTAYPEENQSNSDPKETVAAENMQKPMNSFEDMPIPSDLLKGVYNSGCTAPNEIQKKALPQLLSNPSKNAIVQARTGSGKTLAFLIAMMARIDAKVKMPQALCLAPTVHLAKQIKAMADKLNIETKFTIQVLVQNAQVTQNQLNAAQIIIGTQGAVYHRLGRMFRMEPKSLGKIKTFVLDEADMMLEGENGDQCSRIKNFIIQSREKDENLQIVLISATMPPDTKGTQNLSDKDRKLQKFCGLFAPAALRIEDVEDVAEYTVNPNILQCFIKCDGNRTKLDIIGQLPSILNFSSCVVFCNTKKEACHIKEALNSNDIEKIGMISSDLSQNEREEVLKRFKEGEFKVLISTDLLSRGFDMDSISLVVNYDIPMLYGKPNPKAFIHRTGRTARNGRKGTSISLVHDPKSVDCLEKIARELDFNLQELPSDAEEMEKSLNAMTYKL